jgi:hypothetical protein
VGFRLPEASPGRVIAEAKRYNDLQRAWRWSAENAPSSRPRVEVPPRYSAADANHGPSAAGDLGRFRLTELAASLPDPLYGPAVLCQRDLGCGLESRRDALLMPIKTRRL